MEDSNKKTPSLNSKKFYYRETDSELNYYHLNSTLLKDVFPIDIGYEKHNTQKVFSNKYPYYLMHFVKNGKGSIEFDGIKTDMSRNTLFVIPPDKDITYYTKKDWEYYWINFNGTVVKNILNRVGISDANYYIKFSNNAPLQYFKEAIEALNDKPSQIFTATHCLFALFAALSKQRKSQQPLRESGKTYFSQINEYIYEHLYDPNLSAQNVAEHFFISPCYFSTLFKRNANSSFRENINYERVKKATELLETTNLTVREIAEAVGFTDALYFSKVFKRYRLVSPQEYRKTQNHGPSV